MILHESNKFYNFGKSYRLLPHVIFVFGSNVAGRHGAGAANLALRHYGAVYGCGEGLFNQSYAIPTKDRRLRILPLRVIKQHVDLFTEVTKERKDLKFYVTPIGTGLAGYDHHEIAPMFSDVVNCFLPDIWKPFFTIIT